MEAIITVHSYAVKKERNVISLLGEMSAIALSVGFIRKLSVLREMPLYLVSKITRVLPQVGQSGGAFGEPQQCAFAEGV